MVSRKFKPRLYILKGKTPEVCTSDVSAWAAMFGKSDRIVARTELGDVLVSTVFLGIDHNFFGSGPPLLFETMAFDEHNESMCMRRYSTWKAAEKGHAKVCAEVDELQKKSILTAQEILNSVKEKL